MAYGLGWKYRRGPCPSGPRAVMSRWAERVACFIRTGSLTVWLVLSAGMKHVVESEGRHRGVGAGSGRGRGSEM